MTEPVFFTIVSRNYLAYALTLMQSLARQYPRAPRYLCLADEPAGDPALDTDLFETVTIDRLDLPHFDAFVFRYDIMELNTAVKPYMFEWLRQRHPDAGLMYLDPDLYILRPLQAVERTFADGKLAVLTPHINQPLEDDGKFPTELSLMRTGVYNCGFVAINAAHPDSARLIDWWSRKLEFDCFVDLEAGLFTDQKWMDMAPALFPDVSVLRDDGYNLAYWNLANRRVARGADGSYSVNGVPLVFAHFSGVDLGRPEIYSKHQNRFDADGIGGLRPLYDEYLGKLRENEHPRHAPKPYAYGRFADGAAIAKPLRDTYRRHFDVRCDQPTGHPQRMDRARFNEACPELVDMPTLPISHVMYTVWKMREDLQAAFSLRTDAGRAGFIEWYLASAKREMGLDDAYVQPVRERFKPIRPGSPGGRAMLRMFNWAKRHSGLTHLYARVPFAWRMRLRHRLHDASGVPMPPMPLVSEARRQRSDAVAQAGTRELPGANLLGYARGEFGIAENVRSYARALEQAGYPFLIYNFDVGAASRQEDRSMERCFSETLQYGNNVFFINADQMQIARDALGRETFAGRYNIGFWLWELEKFPRAWQGALDLVDEVWAPTQFVCRSIAACTGKPVLRMPKAIEFAVPQGMGRGHFGLPDHEFVFLYSYDFNSFKARKNPEAAIAAFRKAFSDGVPGVRMLVKSINGERHPGQLATLRRFVADDARIEVRDGFLDRTEMFGLENAVDCYVSPHRSEGFGLGMAECMYLGKPVIATGYSGNLDFMDRDNSLLVDYRMVPLREGDYPFWQGQQWADPDVDHMAALMRRVFDDRGFASRIGAVAAASIRRTHSKAACAAAVTARLAAARQTERQPGLRRQAS
jgi:glycosyltransferase involved in cell wall biosynthesis